MNEVETLSSRDLATVLYYLRSILRVVHPHVRNQMRLLGPAYRCFCEVADSFLSLLEAEKARMDEFVVAFLPSLGWEALSGLRRDVGQLSKAREECVCLLEQASFHLLALLDECLGEYQSALSGKASSSLAPEIQSKVIVFLIARVTSLVSMTTRKHFNSQPTALIGIDGKNDKKRGTELITSFLQRLVMACSLSLEAQVRSAENLAQRGHTALLGMVSGLRPRAEQYLTKFLGDLDLRNASATKLILECFMGLASPGDSDIIRDTSLAKILLMNFTLNKILESEAVVIPEARTLIDFYQALLFVDIPKGYHFFQASPLAPDLHDPAREILSDLLCCLEKVSHLITFCHSEKTGGPGSDQWQKVMIQQHHLLVRWLAPKTTNHNPSAPNPPIHPLAKGILMHIIQKRVILSCMVDDVYSRQDATHLVSLLSQLLFHQFTETSHRRNLGTLLVRLLSPSSKMKSSKGQNDARTLTIQLLWSSIKKANIIRSTTHNRKRSHGGSLSPKFFIEDMYTICGVMEALAKQTILSRRSICSDASSEMRQLWDGILNKSHNTGATDQIIFLLSLSVGALRATRNLADFSLPIAAGIPKLNSSSNTIIEGVLSFSELHLGAKSNSPRKSGRRVLMQSICIQLISALAECAKRDVSEVQLKRMGNFLKEASVSNLEDTSIRFICLQYDALCVSSRLGNLIRHEFGQESWQPLVEIINCALMKSSWYYTSPGISSLVIFLKALPSPVKTLVGQKIPLLTRDPPTKPLKRLFTSRLQGRLFSIVEKKEIDPMSDNSYSGMEESRVLQICCSDGATESLYFLEGDKTILMKSGSKVFVHRNNDGTVVAMAIAPTCGVSTSPSEFFSAFRDSDFDTHSTNTDCVIRLE